MKKILPFLVLGVLGNATAIAQDAATELAGYYLLESKTVAFVKPTTASYIAAYSSPQGGKVVKEDANCTSNKPTLWAFEEATPAFLLIRPSGKTAANVVPLQTPLFSLNHVETATGELPDFRCTASANGDGVTLEIRRWNATGHFEAITTFLLSAIESPLRFSPAAENTNGIYEARMVYKGTELWTSAPFGNLNASGQLTPFPNPTHNGQFALFTQEGGMLLLKDIKGSTILTQPLKSGLNQLSLPAAAMSAGIYTGQFVSEERTKIQTFRLNFAP